MEKASEFLNSIITNVAAETGDLLFKESIYLVFFMTATTPPDYPITDFRSITVKNLNLELLEPQEVLNCLLQAFPHHHLLQNADDPTSEAARTWKIFLTDQGVVPKFLFLAIERERGFSNFFFFFFLFFFKKKKKKIFF